MVTGPEEKASLRLWLKLLDASQTIEKEIKRRLRVEFGVTLPRFDVMAALERNPDGLTMGALSRRLRVSNGNVTGVVDRLVREGLVTREAQEHDRRIFRIVLTKEGSEAFARMAEVHHGWIAELLGDLQGEDLEIMAGLLDRTLGSVNAALEKDQKREEETAA